MTDQMSKPARRLMELFVALKRDRGYTQAELGKLANIEQPAAGKILRGIRLTMFAETVDELRATLGIDPRYFFDTVLVGGSYRSYLPHSDDERESRPVVPAANANTGYERTEDHETSAGAERRLAREAAERAKVTKIR